MSDNLFDDDNNVKRRQVRLKYDQQKRNQQRRDDWSDQQSRDRQSPRRQKQVSKQIILHLKNLATDMQLEELLAVHCEPITLPGFMPQVVSDRDAASVGTVIICGTGNEQQFLVGIWLQQRNKRLHLSIGLIPLLKESDVNWALPPEGKMSYRQWQFEHESKAPSAAEISQTLDQFARDFSNMVDAH